MNRKPRVIALVGPTGSGKTETAIWLSEKLDGEIVSMDSMQIYRGMDIGTAKPTPDQMKRAVHHMIDVADPHDIFTVSAYREMAFAAIDDILARGKLPILAGGTGLYLNALSYEMSMGEACADMTLRHELNETAKMPGGARLLHERLMRCDPVSAGRLHENDIRRVIRAIEVFETTNKPISERADETKQEGPYRITVYGLSLPRATMYARINERVDEMVCDGLVDEVKALLAQGVQPMKEGGAMQAIGYKEIVCALRGEMPLERAIDLIKLNSRHYAKRQWTWFRRDSRTQWFDWSDYQSGEHLKQALLDKVRDDLNK